MILILSLVFILLIFLFGSNKTAQSIVTTLINFGVFFSILFAIYFGMNSILATIIGCVIISLITLFYQNEINIKTTSAFYSVLVVLVISMSFTFFICYYSNIQGFPIGQYEIRVSNGYSDEIEVNMMFLQIAVILIVLIGSAIDTSLSVSSALYEVKEHNPNLTKIEVFNSGISIGKGIIGSTINTLFFIFIAEYLSLFLYLVKYYDFVRIINSKEFTQEVITISIAGIASVLIIPITAFICSRKYK
ncbi:MAG: YibE/F family protein [Peptostreptococcaceae bacterium]|nr:YibE/F family protein [Peptostreptococcaceae bacterium]